MCITAPKRCAVWVGVSQTSDLFSHGGLNKLGVAKFFWTGGQKVMRIAVIGLEKEKNKSQHRERSKAHLIDRNIFKEQHRNLYFNSVLRRPGLPLKIHP